MLVRHFPVGRAKLPDPEALEVQRGARIDDEPAVVTLRYRAVLVPEQYRRRLLHCRQGNVNAFNKTFSTSKFMIKPAGHEGHDWIKLVTMSRSYKALLITVIFTKDRSFRTFPKHSKVFAEH